MRAKKIQCGFFAITIFLFGSSIYVWPHAPGIDSRIEEDLFFRVVLSHVGVDTDAQVVTPLVGFNGVKWDSLTIAIVTTDKLDPLGLGADRVMVDVFAKHDIGVPGHVNEGPNLMGVNLGTLDTNDFVNFGFGFAQSKIDEDSVVHPPIHADFFAVKLETTPLAPISSKELNGYTIDVAGFHVPEPSTYLLFAVGILAIIGMGYRQRKKAA